MTVLLDIFVGLQLKAEHKPLLHMNKWKSKIEKFGNEEIDARDDDTPKIFFRRDARLTLQDEKMVTILHSHFHLNTGCISHLP